MSEKTEKKMRKPPGSGTYGKAVQVLLRPPESRDVQVLEQLVPWLKGRSEILSKCDPAVVLDILQHCSVESYNVDNVIIKSDERGDCFYIILEGVVSVWLNGLDDPQMSKDKQGKRTAKIKDQFGVNISKLRPGQGFGEVALINKDCTRTASVICEEPCFLLTINREVYSRCIKSWQSRELYERYNFLHNSIFFSMLSQKHKHQVALELRKQCYKFGNSLVKQGSPATGLYFITSGQVKMTCQPLKLHKVLLYYKSHLLPVVDHPVPYIEDDNEEDSLTEQHTVNICLLSAYDLVGSLEMSLDLPVSTCSVDVEQEVTCFFLPRSSYVKIIKDKSLKTVAGFLWLAIKQTEGRLERYPEALKEFKSAFMTILNKAYHDLMKNDRLMMRSIEQALSSREFSGSGYGKTLYYCKAKEDNSQEACNTTKPETESSWSMRAAKPVDDKLREDGKLFLSSLIPGAPIKPVIQQAMFSSAQRYAVTVALNSPYKAKDDYIRSLISGDSVLRRVSAWNSSEVLPRQPPVDDVVIFPPATRSLPPSHKQPATSVIACTRSPKSYSIYKNLDTFDPRPLPKLKSLLRSCPLPPISDKKKLLVHGAPLSSSAAEHS